MALFRRKPGTIEVEQFTQAIVEAYVFDGGRLPRGVRRRSVHFHRGSRTIYSTRFTVRTIHGQDADIVAGDWIMPEPDGEHFYPCKPDVFEATYEAVATGARADGAADGSLPERAENREKPES